MNTDSEQSGSSPAGTGEARLLFFCIFFIVNKWTTETSFIRSIKYCYLQYLCCLLCNPTTRVNQINQRLGHIEILRAVKTDFHSQHKHKYTFSEDLSNININTGKGTQLFFVSSPGINVQITYIRNKDNTRISSFHSLFLCCVSSVADDLTKHVLVVLMLLV